MWDPLVLELMTRLLCVGVRDQHLTLCVGVREHHLTLCVGVREHHLTLCVGVREHYLALRIRVRQKSLTLRVRVGDQYLATVVSPRDASRAVAPDHGTSRQGDITRRDLGDTMEPGCVNPAALRPGQSRRCDQKAPRTSSVVHALCR